MRGECVCGLQAAPPMYTTPHAHHTRLHTIRHHRPIHSHMPSHIHTLTYHTETTPDHAHPTSTTTPPPTHAPRQRRCCSLWVHTQPSPSPPPHSPHTPISPHCLLLPVSCSCWAWWIAVVVQAWCRCCVTSSGARPAVRCEGLTMCCQAQECILLQAKRRHRPHVGGIKCYKQYITIPCTLSPMPHALVLCGLRVACTAHI